MNILLKEILDQSLPYAQFGKPANYIPQLAKADTGEIGISLITPNATVYSAGNSDTMFTMQSVIKPLILLQALIDQGVDNVQSLLGVEATGKPFDAFNYSDQALTGENINPMINAGAIALCTMINAESYHDRFERLLSLTRLMAGDGTLDVDEAVYRSEKLTGHKNRALAYMLKAYGMISDETEDILDCYFRACSVKASCTSLARIAWIFANHGTDPVTGQQLFNPEYARFVNAVLMTCGMYDGSGEFAIRVGIPAKSGVGGGIMAVVPGKMGIGVYSPALDKKGNSIAGKKALELLSKHLELSIF